MRPDPEVRPGEYDSGSPAVDDPDTRYGDADDLPVLYGLELDYMRQIEPESVDGWMRAADRNLELWRSNLSRTLVIEDHGRLTAIAVWMPQSETSAVIVTIHVSPESRRRGFAGRMLNAIVTDARFRGFTELTLGVFYTNPAVALYRGFGFAETYVEGDYLYFSLDVSERSDSAGPLDGGPLGAGPLGAEPLGAERYEAGV